MTATLEVESIIKTYKNGTAVTKAVDNVSFQLHRGELVALVGPSGSGKTTLLAILAGLLNPDSGRLRIDDCDLAKLNEAKRTRLRREKIGFVFQDSHLIPYLTTMENVRLMLNLNSDFGKSGHENAMRLLRRLGLAERCNYLPHQLSGGQKQRVAIARALVHNPTVVLADEPTASLDTERASQVVQTFAELIHEQQRAGIMVTHDLRMCRYVDKVIQMVDGRISDIVTDPMAIKAVADTAIVAKP